MLLRGDGEGFIVGQSGPVQVMKGCSRPVLKDVQATLEELNYAALKRIFWSLNTPPNPQDATLEQALGNKRRMDELGGNQCCHTVY